jgi:hypothetical protein
MSSVGVDAFHALHLAEVMIHIELTTSAEYKRGSIYWLAPNDDLGFLNSPPGAKRAKRKTSRRVKPSGQPKDTQTRRTRR